MADNPYVNKVEFGNDVLIDLTEDTAFENHVLDGYTFHKSTGEPTVGSLITHAVYDGLDSTSTDMALSANQGKVLKGQIDTRFTDSLYLRTTSGDSTYEIQANTDLNNIQEPGTYTFLTSAISQTLSHYPCKTNGNGKVIVNRNSGSVQAQDGWWGQQIIVRGEEIWMRHRNGTSWGDWRPVNPFADSRKGINDKITYETGMTPTDRYSGMYIYQHTVELVYYDYKDTPSTYTNGKLIGTVASGYRCTRGFYVPLFEDDTGSVIGSVYVSPTGTVKYYGSTLTATKCVFHAIWMIA